MRELCELLENITEEGYTVLFGQYDGSDELYIRISKKGASIVGIVYDESMFLWQINELFEILKEKEQCYDWKLSLTVKNVRTLKQTWRGQNAIFFLAPILMGKRSNSSHAAIRSFDANIETVAED